MCGISGIVHSENIGRNLFNSIRNLEYRGYDSSGMAMLQQGAIDLRKNIGGIELKGHHWNFGSNAGQHRNCSYALGNTRRSNSGKRPSPPFSKQAVCNCTQRYYFKLPGIAGADA